MRHLREPGEAGQAGEGGGVAKVGPPLAPGVHGFPLLLSPCRDSHLLHLVIKSPRGDVVFLAHLQGGFTYYELG